MTSALREILTPSESGGNVARHSRIARPMRILMVVESSAGGTGRHVLDLCEGLIARRCDVHLLYATQRMDRTFRERLKTIPNLQSHVVPMRTIIHPSDFSSVRKVLGYMRDNGPFDVIHGHSSKGGAVARLASIVARIPAFYTIHGLVPMDPGLAWWKRRIYLTIEQALSLFTARIIAVSPEEARAAVKFKFGANRVGLVPNGIGELKLAPRNEARQSLGLGDDEIVVGFVGRLVAQKAPEVLLRAFGKAVEAVPNARLVMVGAGPLGDDLRALASKLAIFEKIHWLGERDARLLLSGFDIFALSSRKEGLPYVVLEAMAAGLPVVATAASGVESVLKTGENGFIVPNGDVSAFAERLTELLGDRVRRADFGSASRMRAADFTIDRMVAGTLRLYQEAVLNSRDEIPQGEIPQGEISSDAVDSEQAAY